MSTVAIPLFKLRISPRNVRHPSEGDPALAVHDLQASILAHGLLNPLLVHALAKPRGHYGVHAGGRRLRALQGLAADGLIEADRPIDCYISTDADAALTDASLAENLVRVALKPTAEHEAFAALAAAGMDEAAIAQRYAVTVLHVRQRMRLGRLHPDIVAALDTGQITLDLAKAYAGTEDQQLQARVFGEMRAGYWQNPHNVRNAIRGGAAAVDAGRMLAVVGEAAYRDAGGELETDLFDEGCRVVNRGTLEELYYAKLERQQAALKATLPDHVEVSASAVGLGRTVFAGTSLTDAQRERLVAIDARADAIGEVLEQIAEPPESEADEGLAASKPADQARVDALTAELDAIQDEAEAIHAAAAPALPEGPVIAHVEPGADGMRIRGYYRPAGWVDPASVNPGRADGAPTIDPGVAAKAGTGLTAEGVQVMRSHRRMILRAMMLDETVALDWLVFAAARLMLQSYLSMRDRDYHHDYPSSVGTAGSFTTSGDPVAGNEVAEQRCGRAWGAAVDAAAHAPWVMEKDLARAFALFADADRVSVGAIVAGLMIDRSLRAPGLGNVLHDALAATIGMHDEATIRQYYWTPDVAYFDWLTKARKLGAVAEISPRIAKRIGKLPGPDISAACARFFAADDAAAAEFGMVPVEAKYARMWVPDYLRFDGGDPPWVVARGATRALEAAA